MPAPVPLAPSTLAHLTGSALPLPTWLLAYGTGFGVALAFLVLRSTWTRPRLGAAAAGRPLPGFVQAAAGPVGIGLRALGVSLYALVMAAALFGPDSDVSNLAPYAHITLWLGLLFVSALVGDLWRALDPFPPLARLIFGRRLPEGTARPAPGLWPAVAVVGSYLWFQLAYHSPLSPRAAAVWLVAVSAGAMAGAAVWGRRWLRDEEGFAGFFRLVARMAPLHRPEDTGRLALRWPIAGLGRVEPRPGTEVLLLVAAGGIAFDGLNSMNWWLVDVLGGRTGWSRTLVSTAGLVFFIGVIAAVWYGAAWWSARVTGGDPAETAAAHVPALVPIVAAYAIAHYVGVLVIQSNNFVALLSDPFGRGWNVLGTIDWLPNYALLTTSRLAAVGVAALAVGHVAAVVVVHDRALERHRSLRTAARSATPFVAALVVSAVVGVLVLPGG
jgi:hypothetical protein